MCTGPSHTFSHTQPSTWVMVPPVCSLSVSLPQEGPYRLPGYCLETRQWFACLLPFVPTACQSLSPVHSSPHPPLYSQLCCPGGSPQPLLPPPLTQPPLWSPGLLFTHTVQFPHSVERDLSKYDLVLPLLKTVSWLFSDPRVGLPNKIQDAQFHLNFR